MKDQKYQSPSVLRRAATFLVFFGAFGVSANSVKDNFEAVYFKNRISEMVLPETCESPYKESPRYIEFFRATIYVMATKEDYPKQGVTDLFAVQAMREKMRDLFPTMTEESPIDRLIMAQICEYDRFEKSRRSSPKQRVIVPPISQGLHQHFLAISGPLYEDSRKLMIEALAAKARQERNVVDLERQWDRVKQAQSQGENKVRNLLDKSSF